ncbi:YggT family protein [Desulfobacterota bacterium]|nr:YggT family protein [Thermodesulfobacteriota bacterium]|tara:strand:+ start:18232 stop:18522 length:291 start_codon:yes stop_codon:yes gene_type:complete
MIITNLILAIANVLNLILSLFVWLIIIRALISWFNPDPYNTLFQFLYRITEPVLSIVRNAMPNLGGIDISPIVVLLAAEFLKSFLVKSLVQLAYTF